MAISLKNYVNITSGVGGEATASRREMILRVFTPNMAKTVNASGASVDAMTESNNYVVEYKSAASVNTAFGSTSPEYKIATKYFGHVSKSITSPQKISFAYWKDSQGGVSTSTKRQDPVVAFEESQAANNNFGSFMFLNLENYISGTPQSVIKKIAEANNALNYMYLYSVSGADSTKTSGTATFNDLNEVIEGVGTTVGTCITLDSTKIDDGKEEDGSPKRDFAELIPCAMFAATKYDKSNSTKTFMYQPFDGFKTEVSTDEKKDNYDNENVNYIGCTQQAGKLISFYQNGNNADGVETSVYCNEVWLKDAIATELFNLLMALEKVPANDRGKAQAELMVLGVVKEALSNGTIEPGKELTNTQKVYIGQLTNDDEAWEQVYGEGYWFNVTISYDTSYKRYKASYDLIYSKGDAVRYIEGRDIMI